MIISGITIHDVIAPDSAEAILRQLGRRPLTDAERDGLAQEGTALQAGDDLKELLAGIPTVAVAGDSALHGEDLIRARMKGCAPPTTPKKLHGEDVMRARMKGQR